MKLKKIASLALAGIMAVSMLAGCNNGTGNKNDGNTVVVNGMTGKVIAALDKDTTDVVSFSYSSDLENTLTLAVKNAGTDVTTLNIGVDDLDNIDPDLTDDYLAKVSTNTKDGEKAAKKEQSYTAVVKLDDANIGSSADFAAKKLAAQVEAIKADNSNVLAKLPKTTVTYTWDTEAEKDYWYTLGYKGDIAVVEVTDAVTGRTTYVAAITVTRTATKVEK